MHIPLWFERSDEVGVVLYSPTMDAASCKSLTNYLNILAIGTGSVTLQVQDSIDPNNPNAWNNVGTAATLAAVGNNATVSGGDTTGTTNPMGPYIRVRATIVVTAGGIVWSGALIIRE